MALSRRRFVTGHGRSQTRWSVTRSCSCGLAPDEEEERAKLIPLGADEQPPFDVDAT